MNLGILNSKGLSLTIDTFTTGALGVNGLVERTLTIQGEAHLSSTLNIDLFLASFAFGELGVCAGLACWGGKEKRAAIASSTIAVGMSVVEGRMHAQTNWTQRNHIEIKDGFGMLIERNGSNPTMTGCRFIDIPRIIGSISGHMGWKLLKGNHRLLVERAVIGHIAFIEGLGVFGQHHIAIVWGRGSGDARAVSPDEFFFLCDGSIGLFLVRGAFDAQFTLGIADRDLRFVVAILDIGTLIVFLDPSIDVFHVKS